MSCTAPRSVLVAPPRRSAFTLIELLVVIAVISILASMTMPAMLDAMRQGQEAKCKSNLGQLGYGLMLYANAHDQLLPPFGYAPWPEYPDGKYSLRGPFWSETMALFLYTSAPRDQRLDMAVRCPLWTGSPTYYSRGYTCNYGHVFRYMSPPVQSRGPLNSQGSLRVTEVRKPSHVMFLFDGQCGYCYTPLVWPRVLDLDDDGIMDSYTSGVPIYNGGAPFRHNGSCMVLFGDSHVRRVDAYKWLTDNTIWDPFSR